MTSIRKPAAVLAVCLGIFLSGCAPEAVEVDQKLRYQQEPMAGMSTAPSAGSTAASTTITTTTTVQATETPTTTPTTTQPQTPTTLFSPPVDEKQQSEDKARGRIRQAMEKSSVRGLSLVAFSGNDIVFSYYGGYMDAKKTKPVNSQTKYRIASVSKTITGILAMQLAEQGRLDLDEDISSYMGVSIRAPRYPDTPITTRMLMTHTSAIVGGSAYTANTGEPPYAPLTEILESPGCFTSAEPGRRFRYSNMGAGMITGVIEGVTGRRFFDYAVDQFAALGMDAGYLRTNIRNTDSISPARRADITSWGRVEAAYDTIPLGQLYLLGHGDLIISAQDLAQFAIALAGDGTTKDAVILSPESVDAINTIYFRSGGDGVGLTMSMTDDFVEGRLIYGHSGQAYGMVAGLYFDPVDHTGVVFITNSASTKKAGNGKYQLTVDLMQILYEDVLGVEYDAGL